MVRYDVTNEIQSFEASRDIKAQDECQEGIGTVLPRQGLQDFLATLGRGLS